MAEFHPGLQESIAEARRRLRLQRAVSVAGLSLRVLAALLAVSLAAVWIFPQIALAVGVLVTGGLLGGVLAVAVAWFRPIEDSLAARAVDGHFGLPDHALSASELGGSAGGEWLKLQKDDTVERLRNLDWKGRWPISWPKFSAAAGVAAVLLAGLFALRVSHLPASAIARTDAPRPEEAAAIEEMLQDWEKAAELTQDPELKELLAELQPMREQLPKMSEREMMLALSKLENRLEKMKEAASKDSMEASAGDMAAAFEDVEGMGALASALRRKDFEKAAELAEQQAEKLGKEGAKTPEGADGAAAQQKMSKAADKLSQTGQQKASSAMSQMRESAQKKDSSGMCKAMGQLGQSMAKAGQCKSAQGRLSLQLAQLGQCKDGMCQGEGRGMSLMPKLSQEKGGKGAGSAVDPNREKDPTQSDAERSQENLTGLAGDGESQVENMSSDAPGSEAPRQGRNGQFAQYEKLSQQAITDENLPIAYRESIRKYFEAIKPTPSSTGE